MNRMTRVILITLLGFGAYRLANTYLFADLFYSLRDASGWTVGSYWLTYLLVGLPIGIAVVFLHPPKQCLSALGLTGNVLTGMLSALLFTLPMLAGYALVYSWDPAFTWTKAGTGAAAVAFFEELFYRAFLFGQLYRFTRLGFLPSILLGALLFALSHLYQSDDPMTLVGIFMTTFLGALLFAWVYVEWNYNLWVPIFLHGFMNLFWMMFSAGDNAFGGWSANIFRILTIALTIIGTIVYKRRQGRTLAINRDTLWMKNLEKLG